MIFDRPVSMTKTYTFITLNNVIYLLWIDLANLRLQGDHSTQLVLPIKHSLKVIKVEFVLKLRGSTIRTVFHLLPLGVHV